MTSQETKTIVDGLFARLVGATGRHAFYAHAFAIVQNFVDANWDAIYPALPVGAAGRGLVDALLTRLEGAAAAKGEFAVEMALRVVRGVVDRYPGQLLGA